MKIISVKDYSALSRAAAQYHRRPGHPQAPLRPGPSHRLQPRGDLSGAGPPLSGGRAGLSQVRTVNLDEYVGLDKDHDQSYAYFMRTNLFDHINVDPANTNIPDGMAPDEAEECARYDKVIRDLGGIDLQLLGLGVNGHIGFNEPADAFSTGTHQVTLTESTRDANKRFFASIDEVPTHARTMGTREILQARRVLMVASGANKAQAIKDAFFGPVTPQVPASILQYHPDSPWWLMRRPSPSL